MFGIGNFFKFCDFFLELLKIIYFLCLYDQSLEEPIEIF